MVWIAEDDERCSPIVFQDFFKQIRPCLTIDEQLELFEGYKRPRGINRHLPPGLHQGGGRLSAPSARPHVDAALAAMEAVDVEGLEPEKACLLLLLGQPDAAQDMVKSCQGSPPLSVACILSIHIRQSPRPVQLL